MNQTVLSQEGLQSLDSKADTDRKALDEPKIFLNLALLQVIRIH